MVKRLAESTASAYELVRVVFPRGDSGRLYLTLSEVLGNLEVLEDAGRVTRVEEGGVFRFAAA